MTPDQNQRAWLRRARRSVPTPADLTLGVGMAVGTALGYAFSLVVSRSLGPAEFGALSAVIGFGLLGSIPAGALQVVVARRLVMGAPYARAFTLALLVGTGLLAVLTLVSPLLQEALHLHSVWPVVALGALLVPMTLTGVYQGLLLGRRQLPRLATLYVVTAAGRLLAGIAAAVFGLGTTGVLWATVLMAALGVAWGAWLTRSHAYAGPRGSLSDLGREVVRSSWTLSSLIALTSIDIVLARHFLARDASGEYALASLFGKVVFWGTQFMALVVVPRVTNEGGYRAVRLASLAVAVLGTAVTGVLLVDPQWWVTSVGGPAYADAAGLAVGFSVVGTIWALLQVVLFGQMGRDRPGISGAVWGAIMLEIGLCVLWLHGSGAQVLVAVLVSAVLALVAGSVVVARTRSTRLVDDGA